jgi:hypothetical protein
MYFDIKGSSVRLGGTMHCVPRGRPLARWVYDAISWARLIYLEHDKEESVPAHRLQVSVNFDRSREELRNWLGTSAAEWAPQVVFCLTCSQILEMTTEPSPTAEATRFTDPARTSPTAKMPG